MFKRIILAIFGGITIFGLVLVIIGFAMGGRPGYITGNTSGDIIYYSGGEVYRLGRAPRWFGIGSFTQTPEPIAAPAAPQAPQLPGNNETAVISEAGFTSLDIRVDAGYVVIKRGDEAKLEVDGTLSYESYVSGGEWIIWSQAEGVYSRYDNGWKNSRFWVNETDITTTFTVTIPNDVDTVNIMLGMGKATVESLDVKNLDALTEMGTIDLKGVTAQNADLTVNMGSINGKDFTAENCTLECDLGSIDISGKMTGTVNIDCSLGGVELKLERPDKYGWSADVGLGNISIDGSRAAGISSNGSGGSKDDLPYFDMECGLGSIEVKFR